MKERMQKVKTFVKENKKEILKFAGTVCIAEIGYCIGWHYAKKTYNLPDEYFIRDKRLIKFSKMLDESYQNGDLINAAICNFKDKPISVNDLGNLGEWIKEKGCSETQLFTHILAIGECIEE